MPLSSHLHCVYSDSQHASEFRRSQIRMEKQETEGEGEGEGPPRGGNKRTTSMGHPIPAPEAPIPLVWTSSERCLSSPPTRPSQVWTSFSINSLCCPERISKDFLSITPVISRWLKFFNEISDNCFYKNETKHNSTFSPQILRYKFLI